LNVLNIENKIIRGYAKTGIHDIGNVNNIKNHAWNAVKTNNSWKLIDATWSTGLTDINRVNFSFNDTFFLVEPQNFILTHFPDKYHWQFLGYPRTKRDFFYAPIFHNNYYCSKLKLSYNPEGIKKTGLDNKISIVYETIDDTKNYFYKFASEKEYYKLILKKKNNKYVSSITYEGNENTVLTIYESKEPIISYKIKTK
jgi:transglutaminase/protease-like cytokinesis protein 3